MSRLGFLVGTITQALSGFNGESTARRALELAASHAALNDAALREACHRLVHAPKAAVPTEEDAGRYRLIGQRLDERDAEALALACAAFRRFPPQGTPRGTSLYEEQVQCAAHLMRGSLVQMDTGEGKTFALMVAALALLRRHDRVYVVTANPYLAIRDAAKTAPYWTALGISVGAALPKGYEARGWRTWDARVVYTTANSLVFRKLDDDLVPGTDQRSLRAAAVLVDEVDAILLDAESDTYRITRAVSARTKNWRLAASLARELGDRHVERARDPNIKRVYLTAAGQQHVRDVSGTLLDEAQHLGLYRDIELAYAGLFEAVEGRDYEIINHRVVPLDPQSGWRRPEVTPDWVAPLASARGLMVPPHLQAIHVTSGLDTLLGFDHFAGTSGTVVDEAVEYLLLAQLPLAIIRPRHKRRHGRRPDLYFPSLADAEEHIEQVAAREAPLRPLLVVASAKPTVYQLCSRLRETLPEDVDVRLALGESAAQERQFEDAGRPAVVLVSTRQAGRGVDIPLDERARENGGSLLILLGHSSEPRHDRQLLGRVGRRGNPYTAYFCNHPDDDLVSLIPLGARVGRAWPRRGVESRTMDRGLHSLQRSLRQLKLQRFAGNVTAKRADGDVYRMLEGWRRAAQEHTDGSLFGRPFLEHIATTFIAYHLPSLGTETVTQPEAARIAAQVGGALGLDGPADELHVRVLGQAGEAAKQIITTHLVDRLDEAMRENVRRTEELTAQHHAAAAAAWGLQVLAVLRARVDRLSGAAPAPAHVCLPPGWARAGTPGPRFSWADAREWVREGLAQRLGAPVRVPDTAQVAPSAENPDETTQILQELRGLVVRTVRLPVTPGAPAAADLEALSEGLSRAVGRFQERVAAVPLADAAARKTRGRDPVSIVSETLTETSDAVNDGLQRLRFQVTQRQLSALRHQSAYCAGTEDLLKVHESNLVKQLVVNLRKGADPAVLDALFTARDASVYVPPSIGEVTDFARRFTPPATADDDLDHRPSGERDTLVRYFLDSLANTGDARRGPRPEEVAPALNALLDATPLAAMSTPEGVAEAMDRWRKDPVRLRPMPWRRRKVDRTVRDFLDFLNAQGVVARRPKGVRTRSQVMWRRATARLGAPRLAAGVLTVTAAVAVGLFLAMAHVGGPVSSTGWGRLLDLSLSGGMLGAASVLGPALVATLGATFVGWLPRGYGDVVGNSPAERILALLAAITVSIWLANAAEPTRGWARDAVVVAVLLAAAVVVRNLVWTAQNVGRVHVPAALIGVFVLGVALPALGRQHGTAVIVPALLGVAVILSRGLFRLRLPVSSMQWTEDGGDAGHAVPSMVPLPVPERWPAHCYALLAALATGAVLRGRLDALGESLVTGAVYLVVYSLWARRLAVTATAPGRWTSRLRGANQAYRPTAGRPTLESGLASLRRLLVAREVATASLIVVCAVLVGSVGSLFGGPDVNLGLLAAGLGIIGAELISAAVLSLSQVVGSERPAGGGDTETLSGSMVGDVQEVLTRFGKRVSLLVVAFLVLRGIADLIDVWEVAAGLWRWVEDVLAQP
ncbi:hypothetical protein [Geodermatophilus poikilotrophus]|uniref:SecA DEAD-like domain-containing protein n=1 Tax=Geodermatophilus poikilotrophus TaxID=1333667 RepID=A0A1I0DSC5_9ACTN|nr:hypothetical protein [Geodermatophilus poikilotrophus]SET35488.1 SecA DEAD-like domain-containing protein [Geodermatophilus poikilotrophus]